MEEHFLRLPLGKVSDTLLGFRPMLLDEDISLKIRKAAKKVLFLVARLLRGGGVKVFLFCS